MSGRYRGETRQSGGEGETAGVQRAHRSAHQQAPRHGAQREADQVMATHTPQLLQRGSRGTGETGERERGEDTRLSPVFELLLLF